MNIVYGMLDIKGINLLLTERIKEEGKYHFFLKSLPKGTGLKESDVTKLVKGQRAAHLFPADTQAVVGWAVGAKAPPDILSNSYDLLIVHRRVQEIMKRVNQGETEYIPLALSDAKGKSVSKDFFIVNPLGMQDVLNEKTTHLKWDSPLHNYRLGFVLDRKKLPQAPDLFRIKGHPTTYLISRKLAGHLRKLSPKISNLHYLELYEME